MSAVPSTRGGCFIGKIYRLRPPTPFPAARADDQSTLGRSLALTGGHRIYLQVDTTGQDGEGSTACEGGRKPTRSTMPYGQGLEQTMY